MVTRLIFYVSLLALLCAAQTAQADIREYVRDYSYQGAAFDTRTTCRINAIDGVKQELLAELGSYVGSVVKINQDTLGQSYMSHDVINITAGIVALRLLDEKWNQPVYFVKASMKADPNDVLSKLKAMRADLELEKNLRESYEELERARNELAQLRAQLAKLQQPATSVPKVESAVAQKPAQPEHLPVVKRMQQMEEQAQQEIEKNRVEVAAPATQPPAVPPVPSLKSTPPQPAERQADTGSVRGQEEMESALKEEKQAPPVVPVVPLAVATVAPAPMPQITATLAQEALVKSEQAAPNREELLGDYKRAADTIEVEEAFQSAMLVQAKGDFSAVLVTMRKLADKGHAKAQARMGWLYQHGLGVPQDFHLAREWYEKARANGLADAIAHIGKLYEHGLGVEKDYLKAVDYYQQAINEDSALGYAHMGGLYMTGRGVQLNRVTAARYFRGGMERGNYKAMANLAFLYQKGRGGEDQDKRAAVELYQKAIEHGEPLAMTRLGEMYNEGEGGLPVDHDKALSLLREAVRHKDAHAHAFLGFMYENGWALEQDYAEAKRLYEHAADKDVPFAELRLGVLYRDGSGVPRDLEKATYWLKRAVSHGNEKAEKVLNKLTDRHRRF